MNRRYKIPYLVPARKFALTCLAVAVSNAVANPAGPIVITGAASFASNGNVLSVTNAPGTIINWQQFAIGPTDVTRFIQQSSQSAVLNRIVGQDPSQILGTLQSNGRVLLVNPNGIVFGPTASVDVFGLVASSLKLDDADFLAGRYKFSGGDNSGVINQGRITTPVGGSVYLVGSRVENSGIITSPQGAVLLAAGNTVTLADTDTPAMTVTLSADGNQALNLGTIDARGGGRVDIYGALVAQKGVIQADSASVDAFGRVTLSATGTTELTGEISATSTIGKGGDVRILGDQVSLSGNAKIDVSGATGGGTVLVGGDWQGANPSIKNATSAQIAPGAIIRANATNEGNGGKVVVWAQQNTDFDGLITARGGPQGGDGGRVETSGHQLVITGRVDTLATKGKSGSWLLDPSVFCITDNPALCAAGASIVTTSQVDSAAASNAWVTYAATDYLQFLTGGTWNVGATLSGLTMTAPYVKVAANVYTNTAVSITASASGTSTTYPALSGVIDVSGTISADPSTYGSEYHFQASTINANLTIDTRYLDMRAGQVNGQIVGNVFQLRLDDFYNRAIRYGTPAGDSSCATSLCVNQQFTGLAVAQLDLGFNNGDQSAQAVFLPPVSDIYYNSGTPLPSGSPRRIFLTGNNIVVNGAFPSTTDYGVWAFVRNSFVNNVGSSAFAYPYYGIVATDTATMTLNGLTPATLTSRYPAYPCAYLDTACESARTNAWNAYQHEADAHPTGYLTHFDFNTGASATTNTVPQAVTDTCATNPVLCSTTTTVTQTPTVQTTPVSTTPITVVPTTEVSYVAPVTTNTTSNTSAPSSSTPTDPVTTQTSAATTNPATSSTAVMAQETTPTTTTSAGSGQTAAANLSSAPSTTDTTAGAQAATSATPATATTTPATSTSLAPSTTTTTLTGAAVLSNAHAIDAAKSSSQLTVEARQSSSQARHESNLAKQAANDAKQATKAAKVELTKAVAAESEAKQATTRAAAADAEVKQAEADIKSATSPQQKDRAEKRKVSAEAKRAEADSHRAAAEAVHPELMAIQAKAEAKQAEAASRRALAAYHQAAADSKFAIAEAKESRSADRKAAAERRADDRQLAMIRYQAKADVGHGRALLKQEEASVRDLQAHTKRLESAAFRAEARLGTGGSNALKQEAQATKVMAETRLVTLEGKQVQRRTEAARAFAKTAVASTAYYQLATLASLRHEFKADILKPALTVLERDPTAANLPDCQSDSDEVCLPSTKSLASVSGIPRLPSLKPTISFIPEIERKVAVVIGINRYQDSTIPSLESAVPDADAVGQLLSEKLGYEARIVRNASRADIVRALSRLAKEMRPSDSVVVYYGGHGYLTDQDEVTMSGYWLPSDAAADNPKNWIANRDIARLLGKIKARQVMLISDSCYSGLLVETPEVGSPRPQREPRKILEQRTVTVMSSGGEEPVTDAGKDGHSIFAWNLLHTTDKLSSYAPGIELFNEVKQAVVLDFPQVPQYGTSKTAGHFSGGDYLFEVRRYK